MAVPKTPKLGVGMAVHRKDRTYKYYTHNPMSTSFFVRHILLRLYSEITEKSTVHEK